MFVSAKVLEREKDHIEGFSPEVAWVTRAFVDIQSLSAGLLTLFALQRKFRSRRAYCYPPDIRNSDVSSYVPTYLSIRRL